GRAWPGAASAPACGGRPRGWPAPTRAWGTSAASWALVNDRLQDVAPRHDADQLAVPNHREAGELVLVQHGRHLLEGVVFAAHLRVRCHDVSDCCTDVLAHLFVEPAGR